MTDTTALPATRQPPALLRRCARAARGRVTAGAARAVAWRWHLAAPGLTGAVLVSVAAGGITNWAWHGLGPWAGVGVAGVFALRLDHRI